MEENNNEPKATKQRKAKKFVSLEEKKALVSELDAHIAQGGIKKEFAEQHGFHPTYFDRWRNQLKAAEPKPTPGVQRYEAAEKRVAVREYLEGKPKGVSMKQIAQKYRMQTGTFWGWLKRWGDQVREEMRVERLRGKQADPLDDVGLPLEQEIKLRFVCPVCGTDLIEHSEKMIKKLKNIAGGML